MVKVSDDDLSDELGNLYNRFLEMEGETEFGRNLIEVVRNAAFNLNGALIIHLDRDLLDKE